MKYLFHILILVLLVSGCIGNSENTEPPSVPDSKTFVINIEALNGDTTNIKKADYTNWIAAVAKIGIWKNLISDNIKNQYSILAGSDIVEPSYFADNTWVRYIYFLIDSVNYEAALYGTIEADSAVLWEMYFSSDNVTEYLTLEGNNNKYQTQGSWYFYKYVLKPIDILKVSWLQTDSSFLVTYHNLYEKSNFSGSSISINYLNDEYEGYNVLINMFNSNTLDTTKIQLDSLHYNGRIQDSILFKDKEWHYWNANFLNSK